MSDRHASWLVIGPDGDLRWFQSLPAALRYLAHRGPAYLVGLDTANWKES